MDQKILSYESDEIKVSYDIKRCIHAKECVRGLKKVFDPEKRPWINPEEASADQIIDVVERCPTGALHYETKKEDKKETASDCNTISITSDGPVYFRGNLEVQNEEGEVILNDTRWALCRCGQSGNKPACDNTHTKIDFEAPASFSKASLEEEHSPADGSKLVLKALKDGPLLVQGKYQIYSDTCQPVSSSKNIALCRCGASSNKPYCDGTHKEIGFSS
jgi:CDGSH-type Zn-finger protein/uncharacterized Fe-S cluster protein YjdI